MKLLQLVGWTVSTIIICTPVLSTTAQDAAPTKPVSKVQTWADYQKEYAFTCMGPLELLPKPEIVKAPHKTIRIEGYRAIVENQKNDGKATIGVVSTIKDSDAKTIYNLKLYMKAWKDAKVEAIIVGGDIGNTQEATERIIYTLAKMEVPVYVIMGNNDSRGRFYHAIQVINRKYPYVINLNLIRRVDEEDFDLVTLPGYYDKRFVASGASCLYKKEHIDELEDLAKETNSPVIFVSHGPPKDKGKDGIDNAFEAGNVGDERMNEFINYNKIPFGIFGHIGEAGGKATDLQGKVIKPNQFSKKLYLNPGPGSSYPWSMNDGSTTNGLAATLYIKGNEAKYEVIKISEKAYEGQELDDWTNEAEFKELEELKRNTPPQ